MVRLFFDIETLPVKRSRREEVEKITGKPYLNTSFDGNFGRIFCIGYLKEPPQSSRAKIINGKEKDILKNFWEIARDADLFIGHNIIDFDLRFIYKRSIIYGIKPSRDLNFARYRSDPIYDTTREWEKWSLRSQTSLDVLAKIFGLRSSKENMDGSMVYEAYLEKRYQEIYEYCKRDVELTRKVYYKMNFLPL